MGFRIQRRAHERPRTFDVDRDFHGDAFADRVFAVLRFGIRAYVDGACRDESRRFEAVRIIEDVFLRESGQQRLSSGPFKQWICRSVLLETVKRTSPRPRRSHRLDPSLASRDSLAQRHLLMVVRHHHLRRIDFTAGGETEIGRVFLGYLIVPAFGLR